MPSLRTLLSGLRALFSKQRSEQELDQELRAYFESSVERNMATGANREDAVRSARLAMGSLETVKDAVRDAGWESAVEAFWQDLRYAARLLRRSPGFTIVAVSALALGIGANTAIFSVVNSILITPLPFEKADRLAMVWEQSPSTGLPNVVNPINFLEWQARNHSFETIAALIAWPSSLAGDGEPEQVDGMAVSDGFFKILGVRPLLGRWFTPEQDRPGSDNVAILGEGLWRRRYAADPGILGRTVRVDNHALKVVGVMPAEFKFPFSKAELWQPLAIDRARTKDFGRYLSTIARLKDGATLATAQADMAILARQLQRERPDFNAKWGISVVSLRQQVVGDVRTPLLILLGAVGLVLLIACANVANLILMRAANRRREIALRAALGASAFRLTRQFLVEGILLTGVGGVLGLLIGLWIVRVLTAALPDTLVYANLRTIRIDGSVLLFTAAVSILSGILFGLAPGLRASGDDLQEALKEGSRSVSGVRSRAGAVLVLVEVALAMMLSVGAGLLIRSFERLSSVDPGFDAARVLSMQVNTAGYLKDSDPQFLEFCTGMIERVRSLPGVEAAGTSHFLPLGRIIPATDFWRADRPVPPPGEQPGTEVLVVMPGYFAAMNIPLTRGRVFSEKDRQGAPLTVVVNQTLARSFYPGEDPIGKRLAIDWGPGNPAHEIVGVVGDVHQQAMNEAPKPGVFLSNLQLPSGPLNLVVRSRLDPRRLAPAIEREIHSINRQIPISAVHTMDEYVSASVAAPRFHTILLTAFAGLALILAAVGIFGVISYSVAQRTRELGIRRALGADTGNLMRLVLSQGMRLAGAGIVIGGAAAMALTRLLQKLLYGVEPTDAVTFCEVALVLAIVSLVACYIPARRAARVNPTEALRME
jgi:putative ABC transport system permease protein